MEIRKEKIFVREEDKDENYFKKRKRNNELSRKWRDKKRKSLLEFERKFYILERENTKLKELLKIKNQYYNEEMEKNLNKYHTEEVKRLKEEMEKNLNKYHTEEVKRLKEEMEKITKENLILRNDINRIEKINIDLIFKNEDLRKELDFLDNDFPYHT